MEMQLGRVVVSGESGHTDMLSDRDRDYEHWHRIILHWKRANTPSILQTYVLQCHVGPQK
jgi:hypothetical protein